MAWPDRAEIINYLALYNLGGGRFNVMAGINEKGKEPWIEQWFLDAYDLGRDPGVGQEIENFTAIVGDQFLLMLDAKLQVTPPMI